MKTRLLMWWEGCKRHPKRVLLVVLFGLGQAFFTYKQVETSPFYNFGMYSAPLPDSLPVARWLVWVDGRPLNLYQKSRFSENFLRKNLAFFAAWQQRGFRDELEPTIRARLQGRVSEAWLEWALRQLTQSRASKTAFEGWLRRYVQPEFPQPIRSVVVVRAAVLVSGAVQAQDTVLNVEYYF